jgi:glycosyltransferase involved in cell wall biosynthesis
VNERPLVSVVTPSFNYARYLGACLASVRAQAYPRLEHLVLDACSTDGSADVIRSFAGTYALAAAFEEDSGQADAINKGFARARGDVLCWLNADDFWLHERVVDEAVAALEGGADVVTATGCLVDGEGRRLRRWLVEPDRIVPELRYYDTVLQPATFWRRSVHRDLRTDLHYAFDWRLWLDLFRAGARFQVIDREWAAYRMHAVNKTSADPAARRLEVADILAASCGRRSVQHLWARGVYGGYRLADALGSGATRRAVQLANIAMYKLTRRRVFSC